MLRTADKKLLIGARLGGVLGGQHDGFAALPELDGIVTPPVAGPLAWFDASDPTTVTVTAGVVTAWNDKGSGAAHATVVGKPVLARCRGMFNERPVMFFSGGSLAGAEQFNSAADVSDISSTQFVVGMIPNFGVVVTLIGPSADGGIRLDVSTGGVLNSTKSDNAALGSLSTPLVAVGVPFVAAHQLAAATSRLSLGSAAGESDAHAQTLTAARTLVIGNAPSLAAVQPMRGFIAEVLLYSTTLSDGDTTLVINYLMNKWGIS